MPLASNLTKKRDFVIPQLYASNSNPSNFLQFSKTLAHCHNPFLGVDILVTFVNRQRAKKPYFTSNYLISIWIYKG